jgi:hypothetical protein
MPLPNMHKYMGQASGQMYTTTIEITQFYTTGSVGSLGMAIDEERGQLRNVM